MTDERIAVRLVAPITWRGKSYQKGASLTVPVVDADRMLRDGVAIPRGQWYGVGGIQFVVA